MVRRELPDLRVPKVHVVLQENLVRMAPLVVLASLVLLVNKAQGVLLVLKASTELLVPPVQWVPREIEVTRDPQVRQAYKERLVLLDQEVGLVFRVPRVGRVPWVPTDQPALEVHVVPVVSLVMTAKRVKLVKTQKMDHLVLADVLVLLEIVVRLVHLVRLVLPVSLELRAMLVPWVLWESWVLRVFLVHLVKMGLQVPKATKVIVDAKELVAFLESMVKLDLAARRARRVLPATLE